MALRKQIVFLEDKISHLGFGVLGYPVLVGEEMILDSFSPLFGSLFSRKGEEKESKRGKLGFEDFKRIKVMKLS